MASPRRTSDPAGRGRSASLILECIRALFPSLARRKILGRTARSRAFKRQSSTISPRSPPMVRRIFPLVLAVAAVAACQGQRGPKKSGPAVARGDGVVITADEFKSRLKEQSPIIRSRFTTVERKKEV